MDSINNEAIITKKAILKAAKFSCLAFRKTIKDNKINPNTPKIPFSENISKKILTPGAEELRLKSTALIPYISNFLGSKLGAIFLNIPPPTPTQGDSDPTWIGTSNLCIRFPARKTRTLIILEKSSILDIEYNIYCAL